MADDHWFPEVALLGKPSAHTRGVEKNMPKHAGPSH